MNNILYIYNHYLLEANKKVLFAIFSGELFLCSSPLRRKGLIIPEEGVLHSITEPAKTIFEPFILDVIRITKTEL